MRFNPFHQRDLREPEPKGSPRDCQPARLLRPSRLVGRLPWVRWVFLRCRVCKAVRAGSCLQGDVGGQARHKAKSMGPRGSEVTRPKRLCGGVDGTGD